MTNKLLLTPAPGHVGQFGRRRNGHWYKADYDRNHRLCWRHIPLWHVITQIELRNYAFLGYRVTKLTSIKGLHT